MDAIFICRLLNEFKFQIVRCLRNPAKGGYIPGHGEPLFETIGALLF